MKLLLYLARIYSAALLLSLLALVILVVAAGLIEGGGQLAKAASPALTAIRLAGYRALLFTHQMMPAAGFLGALVAGTALARQGELLAIQAAGIPAHRVWRAFFAVALTAAVGSFALGEWVVPQAIAGLEKTKRDDLGAVDAASRFFSQRTRWFHHGDSIIYLPTVDTSAEEFTSPAIYKRRDGLISEATTGKRLRHDGNAWVVDDAHWLRIAPAAYARHEAVTIPLEANPRDLLDIAGDPRKMSAGELLGNIGRRQRTNTPTYRHIIELHNRLAYPLSGLLLLVLVIPWALDPNRGRSLARTLGGGVVAIAIFFTISYMFRLLALGEDIAPFWGAWGINICALLAAPISYRAYERVRRQGRLW